MKPFFCLLLTFLCIGLSCKKEKFSFNGYTATDALGNIIGSADPSDWTFDASWSNDELNTFSNAQLGDLSGTSAGTVSVNPAYPNPCNDAFNLRVSSTTTSKMRFVLVDGDLKVKAYYGLPLRPGINIAQYSLPSGYKHRKLYRVYYVFDAEGNHAFKKGHGDIMTQ